METKMLVILIFSVNFVGNVIIITTSKKYMDFYDFREKPKLALDNTPSEHRPIGKMYAIGAFIFPCFLTPFILNWMIRIDEQEAKEIKEKRKKAAKYRSSKEDKRKR